VEHWCFVALKPKAEASCFFSITSILITFSLCVFIALKRVFMPEKNFVNIGSLRHSRVRCYERVGNHAELLNR